MTQPFRRRLPLVLALLTSLALVAPAAAADRAGKSAPSFTLPALRGTIALDSLRGKVVVVDFWASWCGPCHRSFPWLAEMRKKYGERGFEVVAINLDKTREAAEGFLATTPAPFTVAFDPAGKVASAYHVEGMPTTVLVGRDGRIRESHIGFEPAKAAAFEALIQEALQP